MKTILKDRSGGITILFLGLVFFLLLLAFLMMEMGAAYENYYDAETVLLRCCNSAVEKDISDTYRADKISYLNVSAATADFKSYLAADLPDKYTVKIKSITGTATPLALTITGTVTFSTLFREYGFDDVSFDFTVQSTNYRTE